MYVYLKAFDLSEFMDTWFPLTVFLTRTFFPAMVQYNKIYVDSGTALTFYYTVGTVQVVVK